MASTIQRSFAGGEIAPALYARADQVKYATGLRTCRNFIVQRHGGVTNRPGFEFIAATKHADRCARLIPFIFNEEQTYVLEFGHQYIRFFRLGQHVRITGIPWHPGAAITGITKADPGVVTAAGHDFVDGYLITITGVGGMTELNGNTYTVSVIDGNSFTLIDSTGTPVDTSAFGTYTSGGLATLNYIPGDVVEESGVNYLCIAAHTNQQPPDPDYWYELEEDIFELPAPYEEEDLPLIKYTQSGDVVTLVHPRYAPRELRRIGSNLFELRVISFSPTLTPPENVQVATGDTGTATYQYVVTEVDPETGDESAPSIVASTTTSGLPTEDKPNVITWTPVGGTTVQDTGWCNFLQFANDTTLAGTAWTDPQNAQFSDKAYAVAYPVTVATRYLRATRLDFAGIPTNATILGIEVRVLRNKGSTGGNDCRDRSVRLFVGGTFAGDDKAKPNAWPSLFNDGTAVYGGPGDTWAVALMPDDVNSPNFGVGIAAERTGGVPSPSIDQIQMRIYYTTSPNPKQYYVYKSFGSDVYGWIGASAGTTFNDVGIDPDFSKTPPMTRNPFDGPGNFPGAVAYHQQRLCFARTDNHPDTVFMSRTGRYQNFSVSFPTQDDDAVTFTLVGRRVHEIRHLIEVDERFIILTAGGEIVVKGDLDGTITPSTPNPRQFGYNGASHVPPVIVDTSAIFVQARGTRLRDLRYEIGTDGQGGYRGRDLSVFADHLFRGYEIVDMAYAQAPDSVVWCVRSDGTLLGLTYLREHEVWGWHRHDTAGGAFESICVVPEGQEDVLYAIVRREINGTTRRYVERMHTRRVSDIAIDAFFVDSGLTYDGRNTSAITMTLSGGTTWDYTEALTITASEDFFDAGDVGNAIVLRAGSDKVEVTITGVTSGTVATGTPDKIVPASLRNVAVTDWGKAVDEISGLDHLEGCEVAILADGVVESRQVVTGGALPQKLTKPYEVIHVGIPIVADLETLDLEVIGGQTLADKKKRINLITVFTEESRGLKAGDDFDHLKTLAVQNTIYANPSAVEEEKVEIIPSATWNTHGRVCIRQDDPLPLTVLAIVPSGFVGG